MKKTGIWIAVIITVVLGMSIFSYIYEKKHPTTQQRTSTWFYSDERRLDSVNKAIEEARKIAKIKEEIRVRDSLKALEMLREQIEARRNALLYPQSGYDRGYEEGYEEGYEDGHTKGYEEAEEEYKKKGED